MTHFISYRGRWTIIVYIHDNRNVFTHDATKASPVRVHGTYVGTYFDNEITNKLSLESREITKGIVCVNISSSQGKKIVTEHMLNKHDRWIKKRVHLLFMRSNNRRIVSKTKMSMFGNLSICISWNCMLHSFHRYYRDGYRMYVPHIKR